LDENHGPRLVVTSMAFWLFHLYIGVSERWRKAAVQKREAWKLGALRNLHVMPDFMGF
jgi:hypothetical protein